MKVASRKSAASRSLAQRRADFRVQAERHLEAQREMAVADQTELSKRLKGLRRELEVKLGKKVQQYAVANALGVPPRTFQSWENGEVETEGRNYDLIADYYSEELGRAITRNWILFGQDTPPPESLSEQSAGSAAATIEEKLDQILDQQAELLASVSAVRVEQERLRQPQERGARGKAAKGR